MRHAMLPVEVTGKRGVNKAERDPQLHRCIQAVQQRAQLFPLALSTCQNKRS